MREVWSITLSLSKILCTRDLARTLEGVKPWYCLVFSVLFSSLGLIAPFVFSGQGDDRVQRHIRTGSTEHSTLRCYEWQQEQVRGNAGCGGKNEECTSGGEAILCANAIELLTPSVDCLTCRRWSPVVFLSASNHPRLVHRDRLHVLFMSLFAWPARTRQCALRHSKGVGG